MTCTFDGLAINVEPLLCECCERWQATQRVTYHSDGASFVVCPECVLTASLLK